MYNVHYKCGGKMTDNFIYNEREMLSENFIRFHNTKTHKYLHIWRYQIIGYTAL